MANGVAVSRTWRRVTPGDGLILRNSPGPGNQPVEDIIKRVMMPAPLVASRCYLARKSAVAEAPFNQIDSFLHAAVEEGFHIRLEDARVGTRGGFIAEQYKTVRCGLIHAHISRLRLVAKVHVETHFATKVKPLARWARDWPNPAREVSPTAKRPKEPRATPKRPIFPMDNQLLAQVLMQASEPINLAPVALTYIYNRICPRIYPIHHIAAMVGRKFCVTKRKPMRMHYSK